MSWKKLFLTVAGIGIGGAVVAAANHLAGLKRASEGLESVTRTIIHKLDLLGLTLRIDVVMKNPTNTALTIKQPFVKVIYQKATIGTSQSVDKDITIPAFNQVTIDPIMLNIPWMGLVSLGFDLLKTLNDNKPVAVTVKTLTSYRVGLRWYPYEKDDPITLKKGNGN